MNAVVFYSNTGQSVSVAEYLAEKLGYPLFDIEKAENDRYENLVLVFPVHCQNIPYVVKAFLKAVQVKYLTVIATYGKMCCGNVLYEIQRKYRKSIAAGAYIPARHAYLDHDADIRDFDCLTPIAEKVKNPSVIQIPKLYKNPFADLFPGLRSRLGLKIYKKANCNGCGICAEHCHFQAIKSGVTDHKCIRCLRCVTLCPNHALAYKVRLPLKLYLRKKKMNKVMIYV